MPMPSRRLRQLERELLALGDDAMLLEELDGFIAGLLVCPDMIMPSEWLPVVWGTQEGDSPGFKNLAHANRVLGLLMEHYNDVTRTLIDHPERYASLFVVDDRSNEILWEIWIVGFEKAVKLRPAAWQPLLVADAEVAQAFSGLLALAEMDPRNLRFSEDQINALTAEAPEKIGPWVVTLNEWRLANYRPPQMPEPSSPLTSAKVGRNVSAAPSPLA